MSLIAFDPSLSAKSLCYSIVQNDFFGLEFNQDISSNGSVMLKQKLDYQALYASYGSPITNKLVLNFTALLYFCNEDIILNKQTVNVIVNSVNNFAPQVILLQASF
jgi:hypothetical protein